MNADKKLWKLTAFTGLLFAFAFTAFPFSLYLGEGTNDPDYYSVFGFLISFGSLFAAIIFAIIIFRVWLNQKNEVIKLL